MSSVIIVFELVPGILTSDEGCYAPLCNQSVKVAETLGQTFGVTANAQKMGDPQLQVLSVVRDSCYISCMHHCHRYWFWSFPGHYGSSRY